MMSGCGASSAHDRDKALYHYAENVAFTASTNPSALLTSASVHKGSIHDKLFELYLKHFNQTSQATACPNLLSVLVKRDSLNTLVINLKPLEQGYSVLIKSLTGNLVETINLPYTETELLDCIEQEEIPPTIVDLLEQTQSDLFYDGCVIAEVRDGRRGASGAYKTSYFLLKPSHRTILADINALTNDQFRWSQDDRFILESKLLLATSEPLCLDPTPAVGIIRNRLAYKKKIAQSPLLTRSIRPFTAKGIQKRRLLAKLPFLKELPILAFLKSRGNKSRYAHPRDSHIRTSVVDSWKDSSSPDTTTPINSSDVRRLAKELEKPHIYHHLATGSKHLATDCTPVVVEEYTMETERPMGKLHRSRLVILKKPSEDKYIGELHIDRSEYSSNKCVFELGTAPLKDKYISQFIEIFTEEGRRQVKIVHSLPGQTPKVVYTSGTAGQISLSQSSTALTASQNVVHITAGTSSSAPAGNQSGSRLSTETPPTIRLSADNQSAIKFSLSSQASALSNSLQQQGESHNSAHSLSSTDSSGASLVLARQGLKIQGALLPSAQTPQPTDSQSVTALKDKLTSIHTIKGAVAAKQSGAGNMAGLGKTTLLMSRSGGTTQLAQLSGNQTHKLIGIQTSTPSSSTINIQNVTGLQTVQGLPNVQVSLTSLGQGGIAVPVSLIGGVPGNQPIFLSGPLSMVETARNSQHLQTSQAGQSSTSTLTSRPIVVTTQAGSNQQLLAGHQGLITLPVTSALAQQILAANKQRQNLQQSQQQFNVVSTQQVPGQQVLANQQGSQLTGNVKQTGIQIGQMLANQQRPIQISHLPANQQASNIQISHQIIAQHSGNVQARSSQPVSVSRSNNMQVFHQANILQTPQSSSQVTPQHINIISSNQTGQSAIGSAQQVLHIPQQSQRPNQQQKVMFRQIGSPNTEEYNQPPLQ